MDHESVCDWVTGYERLWRSPGTDRLGDLFAPGATYLPSPWATTLEGLDDIAAFWESERDGPDEVFSMSSEIVAVDGDTAVVSVQVAYGPPASGRWRDLWVVRFDEDGRCASFEEWPFAPDQPDGH